MPDIPTKREKTSIAVLGATGSVGVQTLEVAEAMHLPVEMLSGGENVELLEKQARKFRPRVCAVPGERAYRLLKDALRDTEITVIGGMDNLCAAIGELVSPTVVMAISGSAALSPSLAAARAGKRLAMANKESIVIAGKILFDALRAGGAEIIPVDSEHSAIFQCLAGNPSQAVSRLLLTASGGPFFGYTRDQLAAITPRDALAHPTWRMGAKITVDSATLMNKGFEVIEAVRLFGIPEDRVDVVIHRESIIHSMVEYIDKVVMAQMGAPDMRTCIQYAVTYPDRCPSVARPLDLFSLGRLTFDRPDTDTFPLLSLAREAVRRDGIVPAALNAADEVAVDAFLQERIRLTDIFTIVGDVVAETPERKHPSLEEILAADDDARQRAAARVARLAASR